MKNAFIVLALSVLSTSAFAGVPSEISSLFGKQGKFVSLYNGKDTQKESGTNCSISISDYGDSSIQINSVSYFTPVAHLEGSKRTETNGAVVYQLSDNGKRPGGSACGDYEMISGYKKTLEVYKDGIIIREKFRCSLIEKNEIVQGCKL